MKALTQRGLSIRGLRFPDSCLALNTVLRFKLKIHKRTETHLHVLCLYIPIIIMDYIQDLKLIAVACSNY